MNALSNVTGSSIQSAAGLKVAKVALEQAEKQGAQLTSLIQSAGQVGGGGRGAVSQVPAAGETGQNLDVTG